MHVNAAEREAELRRRPGDRCGLTVLFGKMQRRPWAMPDKDQESAVGRSKQQERGRKNAMPVL
jgi:hypothetical protein